MFFLQLKFLLFILLLFVYLSATAQLELQTQLQLELLPIELQHQQDGQQGVLRLSIWRVEGVDKLSLQFQSHHYLLPISSANKTLWQPLQPIVTTVCDSFSSVWHRLDCEYSVTLAVRREALRTIPWEALQIAQQKYIAAVSNSGRSSTSTSNTETDDAIVSTDGVSHGFVAKSPIESLYRNDPDILAKTLSSLGGLYGNADTICVVSLSSSIAHSSKVIERLSWLAVSQLGTAVRTFRLFNSINNSRSDANAAETVGVTDQLIAEIVQNLCDQVDCVVENIQSFSDRITAVLSTQGASGAANYCPVLYIIGTEDSDTLCQNQNILEFLLGNSIASDEIDVSVVAATSSIAIYDRGDSQDSFSMDNCSDESVDWLAALHLSVLHTDSEYGQHPSNLLWHGKLHWNRRNRRRSSSSSHRDELHNSDSNDNAEQNSEKMNFLATQEWCQDHYLLCRDFEVNYYSNVANPISDNIAQVIRDNPDADFDEIYDHFLATETVGNDNRTMKLIVGFQYNGEPVALVNIQYLYDTVDMFVVVESINTHSGRKKPELFVEKNYELLKPFRDKVKLIVIGTIPMMPSDWGVLFGGIHGPNSMAKARNDIDAVAYYGVWFREQYPRDMIAYYLRKNHAKEKFLLSVGDADEIVRKETLEQIYSQKYYDILYKPIYFAMDLLYYNFDWFVEPWHMSYAINDQGINVYTLSKLREYQGIRNALSNAGWHCSYFFSISGIQRKLSSFAHVEFDDEETNNITNIVHSIREGKDFLGRKDGTRKSMTRYNFSLLPEELQNYHRTIKLLQSETLKQNAFRRSFIDVLVTDRNLLEVAYGIRNKLLCTNYDTGMNAFVDKKDQPKSCRHSVKLLKSFFELKNSTSDDFVGRSTDSTVVQSGWDYYSWTDARYEQVVKLQLVLISASVLSRKFPLLLKKNTALFIITDENQPEDPLSIYCDYYSKVIADVKSIFVDSFRLKNAITNCFQDSRTIDIIADKIQVSPLYGVYDPLYYWSNDLRTMVTGDSTGMINNYHKDNEDIATNNGVDRRYDIFLVELGTISIEGALNSKDFALNANIVGTKTIESGILTIISATALSGTAIDTKDHYFREVIVRQSRLVVINLSGSNRTDDAVYSQIIGILSTALALQTYAIIIDDRDRPFYWKKLEDVPILHFTSVSDASDTIRVFTKAKESTGNEGSARGVLDVDNSYMKKLQDKFINKLIE